MRELILTVLLGALALSAFPQVHVNGYYRSNGTYVQPHYRSSPDGNPYNNWSYPGNTNPYTGKTATGNPDTYLDRYYNRSNTVSRSSSTSSPGYYVTTASLDVRSGPSATSGVITSLTFRNYLTILSTSSYPWYQIHVSYMDQYGRMQSTSDAYVNAYDLSQQSPAFVQGATLREPTMIPEPTKTTTAGAPSPATGQEPATSPERSGPSTAHPYGPNKGQLNFWSNVRHENVAIYVDYTREGQLSTYFQSQPNGCGGSGLISVAATEGVHLVQAVGVKFRWSGYVTVHSDRCEMVRIGE